MQHFLYSFNLMYYKLKCKLKKITKYKYVYRCFQFVTLNYKKKITFENATFNSILLQNNMKCKV